MRDRSEAVVFGETMSPVVIAAHELKTPLVLLRQLSLSLQDDSLGTSDRKQITHHMQLVSERALRLTSDLTKTQRLQDALFELEPVNPSHVCRDAIYELSPLYEACGRILTLKQRRSTPLVVGNRDLLRRVLLNFADNALHYSTAEYPVELSCQVQADTTLRLGVRDYGPALSTKTLTALEKNLTRSESIHARPTSSGLGLVIAKQFAEAMHGRVGMTRHRDGATFYVDLPISKQLALL